MAINKVVYGTTVLVDLTADTVTADKLATGYTAHNAAGEAITGTMEDGNVTYQSGEQATGDYWVDGKPIYRYVQTGSVTGTGDKNIGTLPSTPAVLIKGYGDFDHGDGLRPINFTSYGGITWSLAAICKPSDRSIHLYIGSSYNNPATNKYAVIFEYTKA